MANQPFQLRKIASAGAALAAMCATAPAFAVMSLPPADQWSTYLLYGSIALLVAGVLAKMFTYSNGKPSEMAQPTQDEAGVTIGTYRNKVLSPGN